MNTSHVYTSFWHPRCTGMYRYTHMPSTLLKFYERMYLFIHPYVHIHVVKKKQKEEQLSREHEETDDILLSGIEAEYERVKGTSIYLVDTVRKQRHSS